MRDGPGMQRTAGDVGTEAGGSRDAAITAFPPSVTRLAVTTLQYAEGATPANTLLPPWKKVEGEAAGGEKSRPLLAGPPHHELSSNLNY